jgi:dihydroxyacetone kinase-like predicted kinase
VVVVCAGKGLGALFAAEGAGVVAVGADLPAPDAILASIMSAGAHQVVVLPNDPGATAIAARAVAGARAAGVHAAVVPTRSPVQALAALAVRDPARRFEDDVIAMAEAAGACRHAAVTRVGAEALTVVGRCRPGDVLALIDGEVHLIGGDVVEVGRSLLDRLLMAGGELATLVVGDDAPGGLAADLRAYLRVHWPFVEVHCYDGGQPDCQLLVGVE